MHRVERVIEIGAPLERVFDLFSDFEALPRWLRHVREVRRVSRRLTRWRTDAPRGGELEWEAEMTRFEPDRRIAWRSVGGDVATDGEVVFSEIDPNTTHLRMVLGYAPAHADDDFARLFGRGAVAELGEDLRHFKQIAERACGRRRRMRRDEDEFAPRNSPRERVRVHRHESLYDVERAPRDYAEPHSDERYYREVLGLRGRGELTRREDEERVVRQRERDEHARTARRAEAYHEDGELERERRYEAEQHAYRPRHALTPRERERERAAREWDREAKRQALRRGVERLLDEGPSRTWRRWEREDR